MAKLKFESILEPEFLSAPPLMPVVVANIIGTSKVIPKAFQLTKGLSDDLTHLRRIKNNSSPDSTQIECIICRLSKSSLADVSAKLSPSGLFESFRVIDVPSYAPKTDHQLAAAMRIWPCKYAKDEHLIKCIQAPESVFKPSSGAIVFRYAKAYGVGLTDESTLAEHPVKHATMLAIDSVATNAGAGHWQIDGQPEQQLIADVTQSMEDALQQVQHKAIADKFKLDASFLPYYCTNYDILLTEEPCFMCSMGLVQSRIRRLFYLDSETTRGRAKCKRLCYPDQAIERSLVHRHKALNHRFEAWKIKLVEQQA